MVIKHENELVKKVKDLFNNNKKNHKYAYYGLRR